MLRHNTFYRSNEQFHVRFIDGERKEESYFLYYYFREDNIWICKTHAERQLDTEAFLQSIDLAEIIFDPHHNEPMDEARELTYQSGTYEIRDETVFFTWKNTNLEEKERGWYFRIRSEDYLETDFKEIFLRPLPSSR